MRCQTLMFCIILLPPANEVCKGYVFTSVCLWTRGVVCQTLALGQTPPGRHPPRQTPPRQTPLQGRQPPGQTSPCQVHAGIHTLPAQCMLGCTPPAQCWDTANKRVVCIPLECILVIWIIHMTIVPERLSESLQEFKPFLNCRVRGNNKSNLQVVSLKLTQLLKLSHII